MHVTHGDITGNALGRLYPDNTLVVWRDALHEGPVPTGISDAELSEVRSAFLASQGWGLEADVLAQFVERDATLARYEDFDEVVLWFEHDLYDQLQLIQILDRLPGQSEEETTISSITIDEFPGVEPFHGLGQLNDDQLSSLFPKREPVTDEQLILARNAWAAVREPNPNAIELILDGESDALPYLGAALVRYLQQFPEAETGLSRTERQVLEAVSSGPLTSQELFSANQEREESPFMGDLIFFDHLGRLGHGQRPLVEQETGHPILSIRSQDDLPAFLAQRLVSTERGRDVLAGNDDWAGGPTDKWLGGVFLQAEHPGWRWDPESQRLRFPD
jgi:hypothetical protein